MIRIAVIGVGQMGRNHVRVLKGMDGVELVAIADPNREQLERLGHVFGMKCYERYEQMLEREELDAAVIAVPTEHHEAVAVACLAKGLHLLIEKPIAASEQEAERIIAVAKEKGCKVMIGHIERFNPAVMELRKRLSQLGDIYKIDVERIGPFPNRIAKVGVIIDLSVHDLDVIDFVIGKEPVRIVAETQQRLHQRCEDSLCAMIVYPGNILATMNINYLSPAKIRQISFFGQKGMFRVDYLRQELFFYSNPSYDDQAEEQGHWWGVSEGDMTSIHINKKEPLLVELEAFRDYVEAQGDDGSEATSPMSAEQGLTVLRLAGLLKQSADDKKIIER